MKKSLLIFSLFTCTFSFAQDKKFCQFIMTNVDSREKSVVIDQFVRQQEGVYISRADISSKKYLVIYDINSTIDQGTILNWMKSLKVDFKCVHEGLYEKDKILDQKFDCE